MEFIRYTGNARVEVSYDPSAKIHSLSSRSGCYRASIFNELTGDEVETFLVTPPLDLVELHGYEGEETFTTIAKIALETEAADSIDLVLTRVNGDIALALSNESDAPRRDNRRVRRPAGASRL